VNGGATFIGVSRNYGVINGDTVFEADTINQFSSGIINGNATFRLRAVNNGTINGNADFYDTSINSFSGNVTGTATFYNAACSRRSATIGGVTRFTANSSVAPVCNGTAPPFGGNATCGCG
jgi:hypothetical protein